MFTICPMEEIPIVKAHTPKIEFRFTFRLSLILGPTAVPIRPPIMIAVPFTKIPTGIALPFLHF